MYMAILKSNKIFLSLVVIGRERVQTSLLISVISISINCSAGFIFFDNKHIYKGKYRSQLKQNYRILHKR